MRILVLLSTIYCIFCFSACQKDPCSSTICYNGGVCVSGTCNCPPGYSGVNCQDQDPCHNITCYNGGTCINGVCDCPTGYSGPDCSTALTPVSMTITKIEVTNYPTIQSNGAGWDVSDGADPFITFNMGTSANTNAYESGYYSNVTGQTLSYTNSLPYTVTNLSSYWTLGIWDYDAASANDFMAGVYFDPISQASGFPASFQVSTAALSARIYVTWNF